MARHTANGYLGNIYTTHVLSIQVRRISHTDVSMRSRHTVLKARVRSMKMVKSRSSVLGICVDAI